MSKTISVIGCGWLGLPLAKSLLLDGHTVKGSTTQESKLSELELLGIIPYILNIDGSKLICSDESLFDCDILYINIPPRRKRKDVEYKYPEEIEVILNKVGNSDVDKIIFISSTSVYPSISADIDETMSVKPATASGRALAKAEPLVSQTSRTSIILRLAGLVGPNRNPGTWFQGRTNILNGTCPVNMVHLEDCIAISKIIINSNIIDDNIYNVCADLHPTRENFYTIQSRKSGLSAPDFIKSCNTERRISNNKLKRDFSYEYIYPDPLLF